MEISRRRTVRGFLTSSQFWSSLIAASALGFIVGTAISIAVLSQNWPIDAFFYTAPFVGIGTVVGYLGWNTDNHPIVCILVAILAPVSGFFLTFVVGDRLFPAQDSYLFAIIVLIAWLLLSVSIAFALLVSVKSLAFRLSHKK
jgi:hypothetical protein